MDHEKIKREIKELHMPEDMKERIIDKCHKTADRTDEYSSINLDSDKTSYPVFAIAACACVALAFIFGGLGILRKISDNNNVSLDSVQESQDGNNAANEFVQTDGNGEAQTETPEIPIDDTEANDDEKATSKICYIVEMDENYVLVEDIQENRDRLYSVPIKYFNYMTDNGITLTEGSMFEIWYDGSIEETYPAMFGNIYIIYSIGTSPFAKFDNNLTDKNYIALAQRYALNEFKISELNSITNFDSPSYESHDAASVSGNYAPVECDVQETDSYHIVSFNTVSDILGPISIYMYDDGTVCGIGYRD